MRVRRLYSIVFLLIFSAYSFRLYAKDNILDSLKIALKEVKHDSLRCIILNDLIENEFDDKVWPLYNESLHAVADRNLLKNKKSVYYNKYKAVAINNTGYRNFELGNINAALKCYQSSFKIMKQLNDKEGIALSYNNLGFVFGQQGNKMKALEYYNKALKIYEELGDKTGIGRALSNIGLIYQSQGLSRDALDSYKKSLLIEIAAGYKAGIAIAYNNIAYIYDVLNMDDSAYFNFNACLKLREELNDKIGMAITLNNIGYLYNEHNKKDKALEYYKKSLALHRETNNKEGIANLLNNISMIFSSRKNYSEALSYSLQSLKLSQELGFPAIIQNAARELTDIYKHTHQYNKAFKMYTLFLATHDSINNETIRKASIKQQFRYEYEKRAAADSVKQLEMKKVKNAQLTAQQAQLMQEQLQRYVLSGGIGLIILFSIFVFNRYKATYAQKLIIENQKALVDKAYYKLNEKNNEIMDSIVYARRIQRALLTPEKYIEKHLKKFVSR